MSRLVPHNDDSIIFFVPGLFGSSLRVDSRKGNDSAPNPIQIYPPSLVDLLFRRKAYKKRFDEYLLGAQAAATNAGDTATRQCHVFSDGILKSYYGKSIYRDAIHMLERHANVLEFTYDWTKSSFDLANELHLFIDTFVASPRYSRHRIILFGHSFGGHLIRLLVEGANFERASYATRITDCVFCGTPLFGQTNLFYTLAQVCSAVTNDTINDNVRSLFTTNTFISVDQQIALLYKYRANLLSMLRLDELVCVSETITKHRNQTSPTGVVDLATLAAIIRVSSEHFTRVYDSVILPMSTLVNKRQHIKYICGYNLYYEASNSFAFRTFSSDGIVSLCADDIGKLNDGYNIVQIRECLPISHALLLNSARLLSLLEYELFIAAGGVFS